MWAWADLPDDVDGDADDLYLLHLRKSTDRGQTWSKSDLLTVTNGKNPGLAINDKGQVGFLYQQYTGHPQANAILDNPAGQRWETHLAFSGSGSQWTDLVLASVPANRPARQFYPYIGEFANIMAVGDIYYGVFSANNTPDLANFPQGVSFQRNHNFGTKQLFAANGVTPVVPSIDPFFFTRRDSFSRYKSRRRTGRPSSSSCSGSFRMAGELISMDRAIYISSGRAIPDRYGNTSSVWRNIVWQRHQTIKPVWKCKNWLCKPLLIWLTHRLGGSTHSFEEFFLL